MNIELPFDLREYQVKASERLIERRHGTVEAPTATGKTAIAIECMRRLNVRTAVLVPTINLMDQWCSKLAESGVYATKFYGKEKTLGSVTVFVYNSALIHKEKLEAFSFLIFDEIHHLGAKKFRDLLQVAEEKPYALGLTSHVKRSDGNHRLILRVMPRIFYMPISAAHKEGYIAKLNVEKVKAYMSSRESRQYRHYTDTIRNAMMKLGTTDIARIAEQINNPLARACLSAIAKRKVLLSNVESKREKVEEIIREYGDERILVFSEGIRGIERTKKHLLQAGIPCEVYHSEVNLERRRRALRYWGKTFNVLLSIRCLEEGTDIPQVRIGIIVASGSQDRQFIQRIGRLMRLRKDKSRGKIYVVYCPNTLEERFAPKIHKLLSGKT